MRKMMTMAALFTAACGSITTPPAGNSGSGSDNGSNMGSGMGSGSDVPTTCNTAADCAAGMACDVDQHACVTAAFTLDKTGFIDDGTRWWTNQSNPTLHGTIDNPAGETLTILIANATVGTATITGTTWSFALPANAVTAAGTAVVLRLTSSTGSVIEQSQTFALDDKAPTATLFGTIHDERGDQIDFSTGEPVHTHVGATIDLAGAGCPAVYKYAYLEDETAPAFGRETAPNPLAWQITVSDSTGIDAMDSAYRVRDAAGHVLHDWTSISPDASGIYAVKLYRNRIAALGTQPGQIFVDARFRDPFGNEATKSVCFDNHPMAAPLQVSAFSRDELFGWTLTADSPISRMMGLLGTTLFTQEIVQYTGEPVTIKLATPTYNVPYMLAAVDDVVVSSSVAESIPCSNSGANCNTTPPADPADRTTSGSLSSDSFLIAILDESSNSVVCSGTGASIGCVLPARAVSQAAKHYRVYVRMRYVTELQPFNEIASATYGEYTVAGLTYSGQQPMDVVTKCSSVQGPVGPGGTCVEASTYTEIRAADHITLQFPAQVRTMTTSVDQGVHYEPISYPTGAMALPATTWDSGNDDLPGPH